MSQLPERNDPCPCGSGRKYKNCCRRTGPGWTEEPKPRNAFRSGFAGSDVAHARSVPERNEAFLLAIADALQLDRLEPKSWSEAKRGITPAAVRKINEALVRIWPPDTDLEVVLRNDSDRQLAFYSGDYRPHQLIDSVGRHLIYADKVSLADPFQYPLMFREELSPLLHPEMHLTTTAKNIAVWFHLADLMVDGLVEIIRVPADFDPRLTHRNFKLSRELVDRHPEIKESVQRMVRHRVDHDNAETREWAMLIQPDRKVIEEFYKAHPDANAEEANRFLEYVKEKRHRHPFYVELADGARRELVAETTGSNVFDFLQVSDLNGSYLLTDLDARWQQFRHLPAASPAAPDQRSGVAYGLENLKLPMARSMDITLARRIREEGQLGRVRGLLNQVMRDASGDDPLTLRAAKAFEHELIDAIAEAKDEYDEIDRNLLQTAAAEFMGAGAMYGLTGGALTLSLGSLAAAGALNLVASHRRRKTFKARYPAAMLMKVPTDDE